MRSPIDTGHLLESMQWRYATKRFDASRRIPDDVWSAFGTDPRPDPVLLRNAAVGVLRVVTRQDLKESLVPSSWGQRQVADCSHLLVITFPPHGRGRGCRPSYGRDRNDARPAPEQTKGYRDMIVSDVVNGPRSVDSGGWARLQCYIALGNFMTAAALLGD